MPHYSLYKARGMSVKQPVCAICADRTRGKTQEVTLGYGVAVWLCADHASVEFLTKRGGRDFVATMSRLWRSHGCQTENRRKALNSYLAALRPRPKRARPGSYAWPQVRVHAEQLFASGTPTAPVIDRIHTQTYGPAQPPSPRTIKRWRNERRWQTRGSP